MNIKIIINCNLLILLGMLCFASPVQAKESYVGTVTEALPMDQYLFKNLNKSFSIACSMVKNSILNNNDFYNRPMHTECLVRLSPSKSIYFTPQWYHND